MASYKTGGKFEPAGLMKYSKDSGQTCDPTTGGAGQGNHYGAPNAKNAKGAGGFGSSGSKSTSKPTSGK